MRKLIFLLNSWLLRQGIRGKTTVIITSHLLLQKRCVYRETRPEVSQQLSSSGIKMLQLSLNLTRYHLWKKKKKTP